jgi:tRNA G10  N-methylase Trm11
MQAFALLGAHPNLSLAEIHAVTGSVPTWNDEQTALFDDVAWNFSSLQERLGGTQKLGTVVGTVERLDMQEIAAFLSADLLEQVPAGKIHFGFSIYGADHKKLETARTVLKNLGFELKNTLKEAGRSARYVISREATLSSVVLKNNDLLTKGAEFCFLIRENDVIIGKTLAAQDVDVWSHRDMERPRRNAKQGMLPPKLARMMVNMTGLQGKDLGTVLDPFCGSGTVLMEAGLLGATSLMGGDVAQLAVSDTEANIAWIRAEEPMMPEPTLYAMRASDLGNALQENSVDTLVTETYLGRPRRGGESRDDIQLTLDYVKTIYEESFSSLKNVLKSGATVVLTSPVHSFENESLEFDAISVMTDLGYTHVPSPFEPIVYQHKNQLVGRRLLKFTLEK